MALTRKIGQSEVSRRVNTRIERRSKKVRLRGQMYAPPKRTRRPSRGRRPEISMVASATGMPARGLAQVSKRGAKIALTILVLLTAGAIATACIAL